MFWSQGVSARQDGHILIIGRLVYKERRWKYDWFSNASLLGI